MEDILDLKGKIPAFPESQTKKIEAHIRDIANRLIEHRLIFLCGAGLSSVSRAALFSELSSKLIREILGWEDNDSSKDKMIESLRNDFSGEALAGAYKRMKDPALLQDRLTKLFGHPDLKSNDGHKVLKHWASEKLINRIYTTNFDTLLESELGGQAFEVNNKNMTDMDESLAKGEIAIIHLHGSVKNGVARDVLLDEQETYSYDTPVSYLLRADLLKNRFVFLGFSMNDMDFRAIYFKTQELLSKHGPEKKNYVVIKFKDDEEEKWRIAEAIWETRQAILIPMDCVDFLEVLRNKVEDLINHDWVEQLCKHLDVGADTIESWVSDRIKVAPGLNKREALIAISEAEGYEFDINT